MLRTPGIISLTLPSTPSHHVIAQPQPRKTPQSRKDLHGKVTKSTKPRKVRTTIQHNIHFGGSFSNTNALRI